MHARSSSCSDINSVPLENNNDYYYRPQIFRYKYKTCLEKQKLDNNRYDPDTMNSLKNLMNSVSLPTTNKLIEPSNYNFNTLNQPRKHNIMVKSASEVCLPQWLKYDKNVLRFEGYFNEHVNESSFENYRIRPCEILYYLEDDSVQIIEKKTENSGMVQGDLLKRRRIYNTTNNLYNSNNINYATSWKNFNLAQNIIIFGKNFRICNCDKFTQDFYKKQNIKLNNPEPIPEIDFSSKYSMLDYEQIKKNIAEIKEFTETSLNGGHPNKGLKQFLENDRKVLSYEITWYDDKYDKETKRYRLNYYLADGQIEVLEIKVTNSGKSPFPKLLRKCKLPKIPRMVHCPGLLVPEEEYYSPKDLLLGNYIYIYNRKCLLVNCDEFTKNWYKEK